jgi:hypothetical protein
MPIRQDLHVYQGATWRFVYAHSDGNGATVDLTGYSARMTARSGYGASSEVALATGSTDAGTITLGGALGTVTLSMTAAQSGALGGNLLAYVFAQRPVPAPRQIEEYRYDLELVSPAGEVTRALEGRLYLHREVTT